MVFRKKGPSLASSKFNPFAGLAEHFPNQANFSPVIIFGMGRSGQALSEELVAGGTEALCVDHCEEVVQEPFSIFNHAVTVDTTMSGVLKQLGIDEAERVVTAISSDIEASLLTVSASVDTDVPLIWAGADNQAHAKTLGQIGVYHVTRPEADIGRRIAHLTGGKVQDLLEFDRDYAVGKVVPPIHCLDKTVVEISQSAPITVAAAQKRGQRFHPVLAGDRITAGDLLTISDAIRQLEIFAGE